MKIKMEPKYNTQGYDSQRLYNMYNSIVDYTGSMGSTLYSTASNTIEELDDTIYKIIVKSDIWKKGKIDNSLAVEWYKSGMTIDQFKYEKRGLVIGTKFGM